MVTRRAAIRPRPTRRAITLAVKHQIMTRVATQRAERNAVIE